MANVLVATLASLAACQSATGTPPLRSETTTTLLARSTIQFEDPLFSLRLPSGWAKTSEIGDDPHMVGFQNNTGLFFNILIWPTGSRNYFGVEDADASWYLDWANAEHSRYRVIAEEPLCQPPTRPCKPANRLIVHAKLDTSDRFIHGHEFQFDFGSTLARTGVDTSIFMQLITSLVVK